MKIQDAFNYVCSNLAEAEEKKHSATIGDVRELVKLMFALILKDDKFRKAVNTCFTGYKEKKRAANKNKLTKKIKTK
jgi:hypothetical protein